MLRAVIGSSTVSLSGIGNPLVTRLGAVGAPQVGGLVLVGFDAAPDAPADASVVSALLAGGVNADYRAGVSPNTHAVWLLDEKNDPLLGDAFVAAIAKVRALPGVKFVQAVDIRSSPEELAALDKKLSGAIPWWVWAAGGMVVAGVVLTYAGKRK